MLLRSLDFEHTMQGKGLPGEEDFYPRDVVGSLLWQCVRPSVCPSVCHSRYCIKTTKPILKLFRPSGSPIIEAFGIPCADTKFQGERLHRGRKIHGGGKNWRFSTDMAVYLGNGAR